METEERGALPGTGDGGGGGGHGWRRKTRPRAVSGEEDHERTGRPRRLPAAAASEVAWPDPSGEAG